MEVTRRQEIRGDHHPLRTAPAGRDDGVGHGRLGGRAVPGGDRPRPGTLQQVGGVLDVADRTPVAGTGGGQDDRGERVARIGTGLHQPVVQHLDQPRVGAERAGGHGVRGPRHGTGDVDVHVVTAGQQQRDDDGRVP